MKTRKQLQAALKELVKEVAAKETIEMVYKWWTMSGMKVMTIKGLN